MVMCQEMSQRIPTTMLVEPTSMAGTCQGSTALSAGRASETGGAAGAIDSIGASTIRDKPVTVKNLGRGRRAFPALVYLGILEGSPRVCAPCPSQASARRRPLVAFERRLLMKHLLSFGFVVFGLVVSGCAITDYEGHAGHQTSSEARLWGYEISFEGTGDAALDGTYSYTVKYNNKTARDTNLKIITYRNPVVGSFSRDGQIDREGDDIQGRGGILGGKFASYWTVTDPAAGCQFDLNRIQSHGGAPPPAILLCDVATEEVDKDLELQASFS